MRTFPHKLFYKIGEVCQIAGVEPHVLRYWETEFAALTPSKNHSGQRVYRQKDVELVLRIKQLLYEEGYTVAGANRRLQQELKKGSGESPTGSSKESLRLLEFNKRSDPLPTDAALQGTLSRIKTELQALLNLLESE
ncbi:MAG: MerR family transcriptional regulator [Acidobacteria bacterium]|nr:MerR family transcriptional regulator [Acidobacteriota bacterium]